MALRDKDPLEDVEEAVENTVAVTASEIVAMVDERPREWSNTEANRPLDPLDRRATDPSWTYASPPRQRKMPLGQEHVDVTKALMSSGLLDGEVVAHRALNALVVRPRGQAALEGAVRFGDGVAGDDAAGDDVCRDLVSQEEDLLASTLLEVNATDRAIRDVIEAELDATDPRGIRDVGVESATYEDLVVQESEGRGGYGHVWLTRTWVWRPPPTRTW